MRLACERVELLEKITFGLLGQSGCGRAGVVLSLLLNLAIVQLIERRSDNNFSMVALRDSILSFVEKENSGHSRTECWQLIFV